MAPRASARSATPCCVRTSGLAGVEIDARAHRARIKAGARWADLADPASFLGLAPAGGFDRQASIVGTVLGDGMGWLARRHGLAAARRDRRRVRDRRRRARARRRRRPLQALRGGGVITALELTLHPAEDLYAGALFFSFDRAAEVLHAWRDWTETAPPEITSVGAADAVRRRPRGRRAGPRPLVRGDRGRLPRRRGRRRRADPARCATCGPSSTRSRSSRRPRSDTCTWSPSTRSRGWPTTGSSARCPPAAIDDLVAVAGPGSGSPLATVELRHASGALETLERGFFTHAAGAADRHGVGGRDRGPARPGGGALAPYGAFPLT